MPKPDGKCAACGAAFVRNVPHQNNCSAECRMLSLRRSVQKNRDAEKAAKLAGVDVADDNHQKGLARITKKFLALLHREQSA
jgi:predicted nucleic acid-binding Zn ribbon protein